MAKLTEEQECVLGDIQSALRFASTPTFSRFAVPPPGIVPDDYVNLHIIIDGRERLRNVIRARSLIDACQMIGIKLAAIPWDRPGSVSVTTCDGVTHILKTFGNRSRPIALTRELSND